MSSFFSEPIGCAIGLACAVAVPLILKDVSVGSSSVAGPATRVFLYAGSALSSAFIAYSYAKSQRKRAFVKSAPETEQSEEIVFTDPDNAFPYYADPRLPLPHGYRTFTAHQLLKFRGENDSPKYVSVKGKVFDVSSSAMYKSALRSTSGAPADGGGGYATFLGRDCSRAFATMSLKEEDMIPSLHGLTKKQLKVLGDWEKFYEKRYPQVGVLIR